MRKKLYSLADAAELKKRKQQELLERACRGEIRLCIKIPDQYKVFSVIPETLEDEGFRTEAGRRQFGGTYLEDASPNWFPEEGIDHLVIAKEDCAEIASQSAKVYLRTFLAGYRVQGHDPVQEDRPKHHTASLGGKRTCFAPLYTTHEAKRIPRPTHPIPILRKLRETGGLGPHEGAESFQAIEVSEDSLLITAEELEKLPEPDKLTKGEWGRQLMAELVRLIIERCAENGIKFDPMQAAGTKEEFAALFYAWLDQRKKEEGEDNDHYSRFAEVPPETLAGYTKLKGGGRHPLSWKRGCPSKPFYNDLFPEFREEMKAYREKLPTRQANKSGKSG